MKPASTSERILYGVSTLVVVGVVAAAVIADLSGPDGPRPRLEVRPDGPAYDDGDVRAVPWVAENVGGIDVERVQVEVRLGDVERSQEVDYLPRGASRHGVALLPRAPEDPELSITGYHLP